MIWGVREMLEQCFIEANSFVYSGLHVAVFSFAWLCLWRSLDLLHLLLVAFTIGHSSSLLRDGESYFRGLSDVRLHFRTFYCT